MKKIALTLLVALSLSACSSPNTARKHLADQGYTDIVTTGHVFFGCGEGDTYSTGFTATSSAGVPVNGVVCEGLLKGATIRFF